MKTPRFFIGCILFTILITGCTHRANVAGVPSGVADETASIEMVTPTPPDKPVLTSATPRSITPTADYATDTVTSTNLNDGAAPAACLSEPMTQPPKPIKTYQPNEFDTENRLHVTGSAQWIDIATYRLKVTGLVDHPLSLTYDDIRCMPNVTDNPKLVCPGVFTDYASWTGVPIRDVLDLAGVHSEATSLTLISADGYDVKLPLETARAEPNFLAYQVNGKPLPIQHGFPLRAVFPEMWGSYWLKWLVEIQIS